MLAWCGLGAPLSAVTWALGILRLFNKSALGRRPGHPSPFLHQLSLPVPVRQGLAPQTHPTQGPEHRCAGVVSQVFPLGLVPLVTIGE